MVLISDQLCPYDLLLPFASCGLVWCPISMGTIPFLFSVWMYSALLFFSCNLSSLSSIYHSSLLIKKKNI